MGNDMKIYLDAIQSKMLVEDALNNRDGYLSDIFKKEKAANLFLMGIKDKIKNWYGEQIE